MIQKKVTLQDVADHCSLSKSMVAYVLREPETCKATAETKKKVATSARELNYIPNLAARRLRTQHSCLIGVALPAVYGYYHELQLQIESELEKHGYYGISTHWNYKMPDMLPEIKKALDRLYTHQVDGIISFHYDPSIPTIPIPVVYYGFPQETFDYVSPDLSDYSHQVVQYLLKMGHRRIGYMGYFNDQRRNFIVRELRRLKLEIRPEWFMYDLGTLENGYEIMRRFLALPERPTAIIVHSDHMALAALRAGMEAGVKIPDDLSLISFDDLPESAYLNPALTTFRVSFPEVAKLLVETILDRLQAPKKEQQRKIFSLKLIERESVKALTDAAIQGHL